MSARSLDGCILRTELREHLVDLTLALRTTQYRRTSDLLQKYARWVDTHIRFPEEERHPTKKEQAKERTNTSRASLPVPLVREEDPTIGLSDTVKLLRENVEDDIVDSDGNSQRCTARGHSDETI